jgi:hypothetical protein
MCRLEIVVIFNYDYVAIVAVISVSEILYWKRSKLIKSSLGRAIQNCTTSLAMDFDEVSLNVKLKCSAKSVRDADFIRKPWSSSSSIVGVDFHHGFLLDSQSISN